MEAYESSLKEYNDLENQLSYAKDVGRREGVKKERYILARKMLIKGMAVTDISELTDLSISEIEDIKRELN